MINEALARKFFQKEDPIGKYFGRPDLNSSHQYLVVGIAKDARYSNYELERPIGPFFFLPQTQHDLVPKVASKEVDPGSHYLRDIVIVTQPGATVPFSSLRKAMASVDSNLPIIYVRSLREQVAGQFRQQRLMARLTSLFGILSLILSSVGLYGVTAYNAGRLTQEIGVRMALGADRGDAISLVLRGAFALMVVGLFIGLPLTFAAGRFLGNQLYGMSPYNPLVTVTAVLALGLIGVHGVLAARVTRKFNFTNGCVADGVAARPTGGSRRGAFWNIWVRSCDIAY